MSEEQQKYRQVFKATSLFGGVQFFQIILSAIKSKVMAIFLGPAGLGIARLLNTSVGLVGELSSFGLPTSSVKYISLAFMSGDEEKTYKLISILKKLLWFSGILGATILILASSLLSELFFESDQYTFSFIFVAIAVFFNQLSNGRYSILQGLRKLKQIAQANLYGSFLSLIVTAPLYYYFEKDAIVPAIILTAVINFYLSWFYIKKNKLPSFNIAPKQSIVEGKEMIELGLVLSFSSILSALAAYLLQIYVTNYGGIDEVGLYSAGFLILNTYVGLIFTAMAKDYYPRLSGISENNQKVRETVLQQAFIAILLITPIILIFLALSSQLIGILFSKEFLAINLMVSWGILGMLFKAVSWSMGYVIIAKGDSKVFTKTAVIFNSLQLGLNILGYYLAGLTGIGISFLVYYIIHFLSVYFINYFRYEFYFPLIFYIIFSVCLTMCIGAFATNQIESIVVRSSILGLIILVSIIFSYYFLNQKLNFKELMGEIFKKKP